MIFSKKFFSKITQNTCRFILTFIMKKMMKNVLKNSIFELYVLFLMMSVAYHCKLSFYFVACSTLADKEMKGENGYSVLTM